MIYLHGYRNRAIVVLIVRQGDGALPQSYLTGPEDRFTDFLEIGTLQIVDLQLH